MLPLSVFVLAICSVAAADQPSFEYQVEITTHANQSCSPDQTPCGIGCCPFPDATCCIDGFECCRRGQTCIPFIGICLGLVNDEDNGLALASTKSTPVKNIIATCPFGTTECGVDRCCSFPAATCCSDGLHCCPHGYRCFIPLSLCIKGSFNDIIPTLPKAFYMPAKKVVKKLPYKSCPGSDKICPSYSSCCVADNGQWDCCPKPSSSSSPMIAMGEN